jgi:hypothetical protein
MLIIINRIMDHDNYQFSKHEKDSSQIFLSVNSNLSIF